MADIKETDSLASGITYQYAYFATLALAGAVFYIYVIRVFPPSVVGSVAVLLAILSLFPSIFSLGLQGGWQHFISYELGKGNDDNIKAITGKAIGIGLLLCAASIVALLLTARPLTYVFFHSYSYLYFVYLLAPAIPLSMMAQYFNGILLGLQRFKMSGIIGMVSTFAVYGTSSIGLLVIHSIYVIPIGWSLGFLFGAVLYYSEIRKRTVALRSVVFDIKPVFSYSLPLYIASLVGYGATYVDRLTVAYLKNLTSIGIYNLALLIAGGTVMLSSPLGGIVFSKLSEFHGRNDTEMMREGVRMSINAASVIYVPAALGLTVISVPVIRLIGGSGYLQGVLPLSIMLVISAILVIGGPVGTALQGTRRTRVFILSTSLGLISNLILSFSLIPYLSLIGAAIAYESTALMSFVVFYYFAKKAGIVRFDRRFLPRLWLSSVSMAAAVYGLAYISAFRPLFIPAYIMVGAILYFGMLRITSALTETDKAILASLVPQKMHFIKKLILLF